MGKLGKNISYNFIYQLLVMLLPLITAPYLSRVVGADGVGIYSFSYSVTLYFTYFTKLGLDNYGNREIAACQNNKEQRSRKFFEIYGMQVCTFLICLCVYILYIIFVAENRAAAIIMLFFMISALLDINWFFFGMEQFRLTVIRNSIVKILAAICIFIFVKSADDIYIYILIMSSSFFVSQLCLWPFLKRFIQFVKIKPADIVKHIKPNLMLFIPVIAVSVYRILDKVMIGIFSTMDNVGYYESAERIINVPVVLITAIGTVMLPRTTAMVSKNKIRESMQYIDRTVFYVLAFANAATLGIIAIANDFSVIFYGEGFEYTGSIMILLACTIPFLAVGNVVRTQYLIPNKLDKIYINSAIIGAVINVIINLILIPQFNAIGAAIGTICAEVVVCVYQLFYCRKILDLKEYLKLEGIYLAFALIMFVCVIIVSYFLHGILGLICEICVGVLVYGILTFLFWRKRGILKNISFFKRG